MAFTGKLGATGNLVLGYGAIKRIPFRRQAKSPLYRVQVFAFADHVDYGVGELLAEFAQVKNIGWADYINDIPQAFFTINQDDPKIALLRAYKGKSHVRIYRGNDLVWTGWMAMEVDATSDDAIFYCYGYAAGLFWLHTEWDQEWNNADIADIVADCWDQATFQWGNSRLNFVAKGTIETPDTTLGSGVGISLPLYTAFYKRLLFVAQEMAALGASDTGQTTLFEITHSITPTFNFWADRARTLTDLQWEWRNGVVEDFRFYEMPVYHRNHVLAVGAIPRDALARTEKEDWDDICDWGRMQESLFFPWVRDETELDRVTRLRAGKGLNHDKQPTLIFYPGAEPPPGASDARFRLGDKVPVKINRGIVDIDDTYQVTGVQVVVVNSQEYVQARVQEPIS